MTNHKLVIGNWKMNPQSPEDAKRVARKVRTVASNLKRVNVVVCPPSVFVSGCLPRNKAANFKVGAQEVSAEEGGAHTGEIGAVMLKNAGVEYVIAGHSEQRAVGETDETVSRKIHTILTADLIPIVCVGEKTRDESGSHYDFLKNQIKATFADVPVSRGRDIILAYEPVWAIGAKEAMHPAQVQEMILFVKKVFADIFGSNLGLNATVLYGGSVTFRNAADIIKIGGADGLLVGRESINVPGFIELLKAVDQLTD